MPETFVLRDGPLKKLLGGAVGGRRTKKGKLNGKKIHVCQLTLKNIHAKA